MIMYNYAFIKISNFTRNEKYPYLKYNLCSYLINVFIIIL